MSTAKNNQQVIALYNSVDAKHLCYTSGVVFIPIPHCMLNHAAPFNQMGLQKLITQKTEEKRCTEMS